PDLRASLESGLNAYTLKQLRLSHLDVEQDPLAPDATAVAAQLAARIHDPMAWNEDRDRIRTVRQTHGARRADIAHALRELQVRPRPPVLDLAERRPHALLERRARIRQRHIERPEPAWEVGGELAASASAQSIRSERMLSGVLPTKRPQLRLDALRVDELERAQRAVARGQHQRTHGRLHDANTERRIGRLVG